MNNEPRFKLADEVSSARLLTVYEAWKDACAGRIGPKRTEIVVGLAGNLLPWLWMIDVVDGGADFRFRLGGDRIVQFLGRRYAGSLLSELPDNPFFERMRRILDCCVAQKKPLAAGPVRSGLVGKDHMEMEVIVLPLSEDGENVTCLFGAMEISPVGTGKRAP